MTRPDLTRHIADLILARVYVATGADARRMANSEVHHYTELAENIVRICDEVHAAEADAARRSKDGAGLFAEGKA
jgi:hypothetical protein